MSDRYFLMNDKYEFVEVNLETYSDPPDDGYINNKIAIRKIGGALLADVQCFNVGPYDLIDFLHHLPE